MIGWFGRRRAARQRAAAALAIDLEAGVLQQCPVCRRITDKGRDHLLPAADRLAAERMASNDPALAPYGGDLHALQQQLRDVRRPYPYNCICEDAG